MLNSVSGFSNPYYDQTFFGFFVQLFLRMKDFAIGKLGWQELAADEIQILVLIGIATSSALVGSFLILRRMTMLANSMSHTILIGIVLAFFMTSSTHSHEGYSIEALLIACLFTGLITAFLTEFLTKKGHIQEDASIGLVFTSLFALGVVLVTLLTRDAHIGIEAVMGNIDALHRDDIQLVYLILIGNVFLIGLFFTTWKITTFDPGLAKALGFPTVFFNYLLMAQTSATAIGAFRAVGVLLVLAFITGPPLMARLLTHNLKTLLFLGVMIGVASSILSVAVARHLLTVYNMPLSTSGIVVCVIAFLYFILILFNKVFYYRMIKIKMNNG